MSVRRNEIIYDDGFLKDARQLPIEISGKLSELLEILRKDSFDPRLHTKPLGAPLQGLFSFRITKNYRVGFKFLADYVIRLLVADRRDKIYKRLLRKRR